RNGFAGAAHPFPTGASPNGSHIGNADASSAQCADPERQERRSRAGGRGSSAAIGMNRLLNSSEGGTTVENTSNGSAGTRAVPKARSDRLVIQELMDEVVVLDLDRHRSHCLNRTAPLIW